MMSKRKIVQYSFIFTGKQESSGLRWDKYSHSSILTEIWWHPSSNHGVNAPFLVNSEKEECTDKKVFDWIYTYEAFTDASWNVAGRYKLLAKLPRPCVCARKKSNSCCSVKSTY